MLPRVAWLIVTDVSNDCRGLSVIVKHRRNIPYDSATQLVKLQNLSLEFERGNIQFSHFVDRASCNDSWYMTNVMHKFFSMYLLIFITLYMFRAHRAHRQERQIVSIQPLVTVILKIFRMTITRGCIDTICLS